MDRLNLFLAPLVRLAPLARLVPQVHQVPLVLMVLTDTTMDLFLKPTLLTILIQYDLFIFFLLFFAGLF